MKIGVTSINLHETLNIIAIKHHES